MRRSTASDTGSRRKRGSSLRVKLFLSILIVTLACILFFTLLSNILVRRQFEHAIDFEEWSYGQAPEMPPPMPLERTEYMQERINIINYIYIFTGLLGIFLAFTLSLFLSERISKPLSELTSATQSITHGQYGKQVKMRGGKEVEELAEAFNILSQSLERNEVLRKNMIADISHELRNPLAAQRGHLEALQDGVIDLKPEAIEVLLKNNTLLSRLVEDLQQLSLVDAGQIELDLTHMDVAETMQVAASSFEHKLSEKGIALEMDMAPHLPAVKGDQGRISQVLGNLLANAILFTPRGGSITLGAAEEGGEVILSVSDTGHGIEEEELPLIFERFHRTDRSRTRDTGGTGLGLSIAKGLVEAHGGRIWAESEAGKGTTIFFSLPVFPKEG